MATQAMFRIWRGDPSGGQFQDFVTPVDEGMVVLDAVHRIQAQQAPDLAVRWNCKAGKCGSCSAEINGMPKLMCMTRLSNLNLEMPVIIEPMHAFPVSAIWSPTSPGTSASRRRSGNSGPVRPMRRTALGACSRLMSNAYKSFASASSVFSARMCATSCASTTNTTSSSALASSSTPQRLKCILSIPKTA